MDLATILGLVVGIGLIIGSMILEAGKSGMSIMGFWSTSSMLIVLGGTLAATAVAFRLNEVLRVFSLIKYALTKPKFTLHTLVQELIDLAEKGREGPTALENELPNIKTFFIKDGVEFITQGIKLDDLKEILQQREAFRYRRESHESDLMKTMATYSPAFGMVGTLIGLIMMLLGMGKGAEGGDMASKLGMSMSIALITTFYGAVLANLLFLPFAEKISSRNKENTTCGELIIEGLCLIHQKKHPIVIRDLLNSYLPPAERKSSDE